MLDQVLAHVVAKKSDVVGNRAGDQVGVLRHERDLACPLSSREHVDVSPVRRICRLVGSRSSKRSWTSVDLPLPHGADHADHLVRGHRGAHVAKDRGIGDVFEGDVIEAESADRADRLTVVD